MAGVSLTWLGHSAFRIDTPGGKRMAFPLHTGTPDELRQYAPDVEVRAPQPGDTVEV